MIRHIIDDIAKRISIAFENIPSASPAWVIQIYINDEPIKALIHGVTQYAKSKSESNEVSARMAAGILGDHFSLTSRAIGSI